MSAAPRFSRIDQVTELIRARFTGPERNWLPPERALACELEVSRPLLREAIKRLQMQGYLEPIHGVGVKVIHEPNAPIKALIENELPAAPDRQRQFSDLRTLVEPQMAAWAAANSKSDVRALNALQATHEKMVGAQTYEEQVDLDLAFHREIAKLAKNQLLTLMLSTIADLERENRTFTLAAVGVDKSIKQHEAILSAIKRGDATAAKRAMRTHIEAARAKTARSVTSK